MVKERLNGIAREILSASDADFTRVSISLSETDLTRFANSEIHQNVSQENIGIGIELAYGSKHGFTTLDYPDPELIKSEIKALKALVIAGKDDPEFCAARGENHEYSEKYDEETASLGPKSMADIAGGIIARTNKAGQESFGSLSLRREHELLANSFGSKAFSEATVVELVTIPVKNERTTYNEFFSHRISDYSEEALLAAPLSRMDLYKNFSDLKRGKYTVLLEEIAVSDIIRFFNYMVSSGRMLHEKQSAFYGNMGKEITGKNLTLHDDHTDPRTVGKPYDSELNTKERIVLIENGVAKNVALNEKYSKLLGMKNNGHSVMGGQNTMCGNLRLETGDAPKDEIISGIENGLLITRFHYTNVLDMRKTIFTGMTRDGMYIIKDGKLTGTGNNLRFTINILDAFKNIKALGKELVCIGGVSVPCLKIEDFNFTGETRF